MHFTNNLRLGLEHSSLNDLFPSLTEEGRSGVGGEVAPVRWALLAWRLVETRQFCKG